MTENPYQSPGDDALTVDEPAVVLRWYHLPFVIAAAGGIALAVICNMTFVNERHFAASVAACAGILAVDLPVCGLLLWEWWRTGEPPKFYWESPFDTEARALRRTLKQRPPLDDDAFYAAFYADSGIPKEIVIAVMRELQKMLGRSLAGVHPHDNMGVLEPEMDFADVLDVLADTFEVEIAWRTGEVNIDGTFDSLLRLVAEHIERRGKE
ncbi:MAG: hypothetical protein ACREHD_19205 [Pirellulales bacterium]